MSSCGEGFLQTYQSRGFGALNPSLHFQIPFAFLNTAQNKAVPAQKAFKLTNWFSACEMAITMLQDDINILISILATAVQRIDTSEEMAPRTWGINLVLVPSLLLAGKGVVLSLEMSLLFSAAPLLSQRSPDQAPHPAEIRSGWGELPHPIFVWSTAHEGKWGQKVFSFCQREMVSTCMGENTWNCTGAWQHFQVTNPFIESSSTIFLNNPLSPWPTPVPGIS